MYGLETFVPTKSPQNESDPRASIRARRLCKRTFLRPY